MLVSLLFQFIWNSARAQYTCYERPLTNIEGLIKKLKISKDMQKKPVSRLTHRQAPHVHNTHDSIILTSIFLLGNKLSGWLLVCFVDSVNLQVRHRTVSAAWRSKVTRWRQDRSRETGISEENTTVNPGEKVLHAKNNKYVGPRGKIWTELLETFIVVMNIL